MPQNAPARQEIAGDPVREFSATEMSPYAWTPIDRVIEAILRTGGSYATIEDAGSQAAWSDLMDDVNEHDPATLNSIPLPLNIKFYHLAHADQATPQYLITAPESGEITVTVDGKGRITPKLKAQGAAGQQTTLPDDTYAFTFAAQAGSTYNITLNKDLAESGLYSILATFNPAALKVNEVYNEPIPLPVWLLWLLAFSIPALALYRRRSSKK